MNFEGFAEGLTIFEGLKLGLVFFADDGLFDGFSDGLNSDGLNSDGLNLDGF